MIWSSALLLAAAFGTADREPVVLERTGKWTVDYKRDACNMYAEFGTGDDLVIARFTRYQPSDSLTISLMGKRLRMSAANEEAKLDFGLGGKPRSGSAMAGTVAKYPAMFFGSSRIDNWESKSPEDTAPAITPEQEAAVTGLTVSIRGKQPFRLNFRSFGKPLAALRTCVENLVKNWGYDPEVQAKRSRPVTPITPSVKWLTYNDYPAGALMMGQSGLVQFRLDVDAEGKIAGCYVLDRSNPDSFADMTCKIVSKRAKLLPALDADGKPIRSYFVQSVRFMIGK